MGTLMMSDGIGADATMSPIYVHHEVSCAPRHWTDIAELVQISSHFKNSDGHAFLYEIWRNQIGLPRDILTMITVWPSFESSFDSKVIGIWRQKQIEKDSVTTPLLT